jgi:chromosome segregation ATPase
LAAAQHQFAQAGLTQLQEVTVAGATLQPLVASIRGAAADSQAKLQQLESFLMQNPQFADVAAVQRMLDKNQQLADSNRQLTNENEQLQDNMRQLRNELFSKTQQHYSAVAALREQQNTPADKKTAALQEQVRMLTQQLHARDAALAASEEDNRRLRDELGLPHRSVDDCRTGSDLSPCKAEGERYGSSPSRSASPDVSRRLVWGDAEDADNDDGLHSSTCSIASGSISPDVQQRSQQQQQRKRLEREAQVLKAALAAKDQQLQELQQQVEQLKQEQEAHLAREFTKMLLVQCLFVDVCCWFGACSYIYVVAVRTSSV